MPQDSGKEAKAASRTASKATLKELARNVAEQAMVKQTTEKQASGKATTGKTVPGKGNSPVSKPKPKAEPTAKTGPGQPAGVVLTDKDSIMS